MLRETPDPRLVGGLPAEDGPRAGLAAGLLDLGLGPGLLFIFLVVLGLVDPVFSG